MSDRAAMGLISGTLSAVILSIGVVVLVAFPDIDWPIWSRFGMIGGAVLIGIGSLNALRLRP